MITNEFDISIEYDKINIFFFFAKKVILLIMYFIIIFFYDIFILKKFKKFR